MAVFPVVVTWFCSSLGDAHERTERTKEEPFIDPWVLSLLSSSQDPSNKVIMIESRSWHSLPPWIYHVWAKCDSPATFENEYPWNTGVCVHYGPSMSAFTPQEERWAVWSETLWGTRLKIFTIWSLKETLLTLHWVWTSLYHNFLFHSRNKTRSSVRNK